MGPETAQQALEQNKNWYHTLELAPGVTTPGHVDLRGLTPKVLPERLDGVRALDIGTFDGHWAFEMERRGATVIATDVETLEAAEWPPIHRERLEADAQQRKIELGLGFRLAAEIFESRVKRIECNVYDLSPAAIEGEVDFAVLGALLLHLRDPVRALERIRSVLVPGGELRVVEPFSVWLSLVSPRRAAARFRVLESNFTWWLANRSALSAWLTAAGFKDVRRIAVDRPPAQKGMRPWMLVLTARAD